MPKSQNEYRQAMIHDLAKINIARDRLCSEILKSLKKNYWNRELIVIARTLKIWDLDWILAIIS